MLAGDCLYSFIGSSAALTAHCPAEGVSGLGYGVAECAGAYTARDLFAAAEAADLRYKDMIDVGISHCQLAGGWPDFFGRMKPARVVLALFAGSRLTGVILASPKLLAGAPRRQSPGLLRLIWLLATSRAAMPHGAGVVMLGLHLRAFALIFFGARDMPLVFG